MNNEFKLEMLIEFINCVARAGCCICNNRCLACEARNLIQQLGINNAIS